MNIIRQKISSGFELYKKTVPFGVSLFGILGLTDSISVIQEDRYLFRYENMVTLSWGAAINAVFNSSLGIIWPISIPVTTVLYFKKRSNK